MYVCKYPSLLREIGSHDYGTGKSEIHWLEIQRVDTEVFRQNFLFSEKPQVL